MSEAPLPSPAFTSWPTFPFEGDLRVKKLDDPVAVEPPRHGENPAECSACLAPDSAYVWVSERWRVRSLDQPTGLPMVLILESRSHLDLGDLPNMLAAELGVLTVRLERAIRSLDGVARVHVNRWGDGSAHLHVWFLARPHGRLQLRGTFLSLWDDILPRIPESRWRDNLALVAEWLAEFGGRALAEPSRIEWKAPAVFAPAQAAADADEESAGQPEDDGRQAVSIAIAETGRDNGREFEGAAKISATADVDMPTDVDHVAPVAAQRSASDVDSGRAWNADDTNGGRRTSAGDSHTGSDLFGAVNAASAATAGATPSATPHAMATGVTAGAGSPRGVAGEDATAVEESGDLAGDSGGEGGDKAGAGDGDGAVVSASGGKNRGRGRRGRGRGWR